MRSGALCYKTCQFNQLFDGACFLAEHVMIVLVCSTMPSRGLLFYRDFKSAFVISETQSKLSPNLIWQVSQQREVVWPNVLWNWIGNRVRKSLKRFALIFLVHPFVKSAEILQEKKNSFHLKASWPAFQIVGTLPSSTKRARIGNVKSFNFRPRVQKTLCSAQNIATLIQIINSTKAYRLILYVYKIKPLWRKIMTFLKTLQLYLRSHIFASAKGGQYNVSRKRTFPLGLTNCHFQYLSSQ